MKYSRKFLYYTFVLIGTSFIFAMKCKKDAANPSASGLPKVSRIIWTTNPVTPTTAGGLEVAIVTCTSDATMAGLTYTVSGVLTSTTSSSTITLNTEVAISGPPQPDPNHSGMFGFTPILDIRAGAIPAGYQLLTGGMTTWTIQGYYVSNPKGTTSITRTMIIKTPN